MQMPACGGSTKPEPDLDEVREALKRIVNNGHRAGAVIAGIRSMFRKDVGREEPVSRERSHQRGLVIVRGELESHRISLQSELSDGLPMIIGRADAIAAGATQPRHECSRRHEFGHRSRTRFDGQNQNDETDHVLITVEDSGTGIEPDHVTRIFEAFFTTKATRNGNGVVDLPFDHRISRRPAFGLGAPSLRIDFTASRCRLPKRAMIGTGRRALGSTPWPRLQREINALDQMIFTERFGASSRLRRS